MKVVQLKKTTIVDVQAAQITGYILDDGTPHNTAEPVVIGDWVITDAAGVASILSDAEFQAEQVV